MIIRSKKRLRALAFTLFIFTLLWALEQYWFSFFEQINSKWSNWDWISGWLLFSTLTLLTLLNVRKKLTFLPLGRAYVWTQLHIYGGIIAMWIYALHTQWQWPNGFLESALAIFFWLSCISGIVGLILSRSLPKMMNARAGRIFMARLPGQKANLVRQANEEVHACVLDGGQQRYLDFYQEKILPYLSTTRNIGLHLLAARTPYRQWNENVAAERQFMTLREQDSLERLLQLVHQKIDLDFQHVMQTLLKGWLFIHIPVSFCLMLLAVLHMILVYSFIGG
jgi:hypothetical protein